MSPKLTSRQEQKRATRRSLRRAAARCFADRGFRDTNVADIARAAGVAHGTFYVHFANKEALLDDLLGDLNQLLADRLRARIDEPAGDLDRLARGAAEVVLDTLAEQRDFVRCYLERSAGGLTAESLRDGINPPVAQLLRAALRGRAGAAAGDPVIELTAHGLLAMWLRIALQYLFAGGIDRETAVGTLARLTAGAVRAVARP
jgi:AcrR family transcriptional regulator